MIELILPAAFGGLFGLLTSILFSQWFKRNAQRRVVASVIIADSERVIDWSITSIRGYISALHSIICNDTIKLAAVDILLCPSITEVINRCDSINEIPVLKHAFRCNNLIHEINDDVSKINLELRKEANTQELYHLLKYRIRDYIQIIVSFSKLQIWAEKSIKKSKSHRGTFTNMAIENLEKMNNLLSIISRLTIPENTINIENNILQMAKTNLTEISQLMFEIFPKHLITIHNVHEG